LQAQKKRKKKERRRNGGEKKWSKKKWRRNNMCISSWLDNMKTITGMDKQLKEYYLRKKQRRK
jgi:hypothetical protein